MWPAQTTTVEIPSCWVSVKSSPSLWSPASTRSKRSVNSSSAKCCEIQGWIQHFNLFIVDLIKIIVGLSKEKFMWPPDLCDSVLNLVYLLFITGYLKYLQTHWILFVFLKHVCCLLRLDHPAGWICAHYKSYYYFIIITNVNKVESRIQPYLKIMIDIDIEDLK